MRAGIRPIFTTLLLTAACEHITESPRSGDAPPSVTAPGAQKEVPPLPAEEAPPASQTSRAEVPVDRLSKSIESWFGGQNAHRIYIQVDKPLYRPGETIWVKSWDLLARDFAGSLETGIRYDLVSPKGAVVMQKNVAAESGMATNDFVIPPTVQGGEYKLRVTTFGGHTAERPIIVSTYEPPRIKKKLEMVRKAYGPGDEVSATLRLNRPTGEPLANHPVKGRATLDGEVLAPISATTNASGGAIVRFKLPARIERGDGILTVLVEDGGITESVSKRIPIILAKLQLSLFPEGGDLVEGLESRLYFEAQDMIGKPADVEGELVDDHDNAVARFRSHHFGLGRVEFTPATGRKYFARVTKPEGISERFQLPLPRQAGCVLRTFDDLDGVRSDLRASVRCTEDRTVIVTGVLRDRPFDTVVVDVKAGKPSIVYLQPVDPALGRAMGALRVTLFDDALKPLAERVVFRNRRSRLKVEIEPDQKRYSPREQVALTVRTSNERGEPVPAELALSIVDDTVISFADDKTGHLLSRILLEPEVPGELEEPKFFFDLTEEKSALALELLMGSRGYRRFEWRQVFEAPEKSIAATGMARGPRDGDMADPAPEDEGRLAGLRQLPKAPMAVPDAKPRPAPAPAPAEAPAAAAPMAPVQAQLAAGEAMPEALEEKEAQAQPRREMAAERRLRANEGGKMAKKKDEAWAGADELLADDARMAFSPVRVFPAPKYTGSFSGQRTDFRETVLWEPRVQTDTKGKAIVTFYLSDAVTSFRAFAEGAGGGLIGRHEEVFESSLPFSLSVKLPVEVSAGDEMLLPLTLTNERDEAFPISVDASFGPLLEPGAGAKLPSELAGKARASVFYPVTVKSTAGESPVRIAAAAGGLTDEIVRNVTVVPLGFPQTVSESGTLKVRSKIDVTMGAPLAGTVDAKITVFPSPVSTLLSGMDSMIRQPSGCFEQTSSSNYPNIMVMDYLSTHDVADPELVSRIQGLLDSGYQRLVGYETGEKGYEWFGRAPAHEALSAYGVLEFVDMKRVYGGVDDRMIDRTVKYILGRRDGKGGFLRDSKALDSFGGAKPEVTDAYIVWALTEAGFTNLGPELERTRKLAVESQDAYLAALATNTLFNVPALASEARTAAARLAKMAASDGSWMGADHSITRSTGYNLQVETTSLALLGLMSSDGHVDTVANGVRWLAGARQGHGGWGATQATVLALRALTEYATRAKVMRGAGEVAVLIDGERIATARYEEGQRDPLVLKDLGQYFPEAGKYTLELVHDGEGELPFALAVDYRSAKPASHPDTVVGLETTIASTKLGMGETVRVTAKITNRTQEGQPMTLVRVGIPGGTSFQTWQLKELVDKGTIAFYETRAREVILYFRQLTPSEVKEIPIELVANVPGHYVGPASSAYLYYTDDKKVWTEPLTVDIRP